MERELIYQTNWTKVYCTSTKEIHIEQTVYGGIIETIILKPEDISCIYFKLWQGNVI